MKRFSTLWIIRQMQINTTMKYHLTLVRMAIIKKSRNNKCWGGCGKKGTLSHSWWECKLIQSLQRIAWRFHKKLGIKLTYDPEIPLLGTQHEKTIIQKDTCTLHVFIACVQCSFATLFTTARTWKKPRCPSTDEWIRKLWYISMMEYY